MMYRIALLLACITAILYTPSYAASQTEIIDGVTWYFEPSSINSANVAITGAKPCTGDIVVPSKLGGKKVDDLYSYAFYQCSGITSVTIPEGIVRIANEAIATGSKINFVKIPSTVSSISRGAFGSYGTTVKEVYIEDIAKWCSIKFQYSTSDSLHTANPLSYGAKLFLKGKLVQDLVIPEGVTEVKDIAFNYCNTIRSVTLPSTLSSIGNAAFKQSGISSVKVYAPVPSGIKYSGLTGRPYMCLPEYGAEWEKEMGDNLFSGYLPEEVSRVEIIDAAMRVDDPSIMDVRFRVISRRAKVKVRALAFKDGIRSLDNLLRPESFVEGTENALGDDVLSNMEHMISWRVADDWNVELAKLSFEVLVGGEDLLPLELVAIPPTTDHPDAVLVARNVPFYDTMFDALLWLYASKEDGLVLQSGSLKKGGVTLATGTSASSNARRYLYEKMGFTVLTEPELSYVNRRLRTAMTASREYAYKLK